MSDTPSARSVGQMKRVLAILDSYADQHHALNELAELAGLSRFYFSRTFRAVMGMSLRDYLRDLKLRRAIELVRISGRSLTDIAVEAGFYDLPHLDNASARLLIAFVRSGRRNRFGPAPGLLLGDLHQLQSAASELPTLAIEMPSEHHAARTRSVGTGYEAIRGDAPRSNVPAATNCHTEYMAVRHHQEAHGEHLGSLFRGGASLSTHGSHSSKCGSGGQSIDGRRSAPGESSDGWWTLRITSAQKHGFI